MKDIILYMHSIISAKALIVLVVVGVVATMAVATTVSVTTTTYQTENGVQYIVTGFITAASNGFEVAPNTLTGNTTPVAWTAGGYANTAVTKGDWVYSVTLTIGTSTPASATYTLTVKWIQGSSTSNQPTGIGPTYSIEFTTPSSITASSSMTFLFDTGSTSFTAPAGIIITVG
ncbi:MAG: hypothetical protein QW478_14345 [Candidatus Micrarchaeaceae archaeon]